MNLNKVVSVQNMRDSDAKTFAERVTSAELMHRAAQGIFDAVQFRGRVAIVCGAGNNGGDGYALACILLEHGVTPTLFRVTDRFSKDGLYYYQTAKGMGAEESSLSVPAALNGFDVVVDCILGTGFKGKVTGAARDAIEQINASGAFVVSADINSGLNGDTGVAELAVRSDVTVSIGYYKTGMFLGDAPDYIGQLRNADIGIELVRDEYLLIDWEHLHVFEGYNATVLTPDEFYEKTGYSRSECDVAKTVAELTADERRIYVVRTPHAAVIGDIRFIYFCADYVF